ncbi:MAG TPA: MBL fold metallo-hydrolase [Xanthobacteraceae bacterium]|nr:MBL fold metallo-hydrolase [Xanthobacteraceae bacterium]
MTDPGGDLVKVRMYRGLLGDCFLLTTVFSGVKRHALIDCGVLQNVPDGSTLVEKLKPEVTAAVGRVKLDAVLAGPDHIRRVAADVIAAAGKHIDLLVLTHEHFDHLSGFGYAQDLFAAKDVVIDRLWMAWTDDPNDEQARTLQARFGKGRQALALALRMRDHGAAGDSLQTVADLAAFIGPVKQPGLAADSVRTTREMIDSMREKVGVARTRYLAPGQVLAGGDGVGLTTFVLGPPRDEAKLTKDSPSAGAAKEVYLTKWDEAAALVSALSALAATLPAAARTKMAAVPLPAPDPLPFARPHRRGRALGASDDPRAGLDALYRLKGQEYRQIEGEWTGAAESLALKMDSDTNNTSLALAMELPGGQVLLFPGDAQVGNWLSWRDQTYPAKPAAGASAVTIDDLLSRVVFYKVGHHGSHNATLKELGLAKMTSPRLTAAIPVVEAVAAVQGKGRTNPGQGWQMPYDALYADLKARTKGRIVRGDGDPAHEAAAFADAPTPGPRPVTVVHDRDGLWVELTFPVMQAG